VTTSTATYSRARWLANVVGQDVALAVALLVLAWTGGGTFARVLLVAIPIVLAWGVVTLHFPSRVEWTSESITFAGYGRAHTFMWRDVERVRIRRFLVRDRILVRISPAPAWRGRYWLLTSIDGFDALARELESRAKT
jgi:hypothetical protein